MSLLLVVSLLGLVLSTGVSLPLLRQDVAMLNGEELKDIQDDFAPSQTQFSRWSDDDLLEAEERKNEPDVEMRTSHENESQEFLQNEGIFDNEPKNKFEEAYEQLKATNELDQATEKKVEDETVDQLEDEGNELEDEAEGQLEGEAEDKREDEAQELGDEIKDELDKDSERSPQLELEEDPKEDDNNGNESNPNSQVSRASLHYLTPLPRPGRKRQLNISE